MNQKILFIENSLLPSRGGVERVTDVLSKAFTKDGHSCYYAYWSIDNPEYSENSKFYLNFKDSYKNFNNKFRAFVIDNHIDIIINQGLCQRKLLQTLTKIKSQQNIKIITCLHNTPEFINHIQPPASIKIKLILLLKSILMGGNVYIKERQAHYDISDHYVVLSPSFIPQIQTFLKFKDTSKIQAISNPITLASDIAHQQCLSMKEKKVLIVSRFDENQKNLKSALRIWKKVSDQMPDWKLSLIGYGEEEAEYQQYIKELDIKNITIEGKKENPSEYYAQSSIFMMTSHYEGFGLTLVEALQHACIPFVFDTFAAVHDIITDKENGFIIPPYDEELYAETMIEFMKNSNKQKEFAQNSFSYIDKFKLENILPQWYELINSK